MYPQNVLTERQYCIVTLQQPYHLVLLKAPPCHSALCFVASLRWGAARLINFRKELLQHAMHNARLCDLIACNTDSSFLRQERLAIKCIGTVGGPGSLN